MVTDTQDDFHSALRSVLVSHKHCPWDPHINPMRTAPTPEGHQVGREKHADSNPEGLHLNPGSVLASV